MPRERQSLVRPRRPVASPFLLGFLFLSRGHDSRRQLRSPAGGPAGCSSVSIGGKRPRSPGCALGRRATMRCDGMRAAARTLLTGCGGAILSAPAPRHPRHPRRLHTLKRRCDRLASRWPDAARAGQQRLVLLGEHPCGRAAAAAEAESLGRGALPGPAPGDASCFRALTPSTRPSLPSFSPQPGSSRTPLQPCVVGCPLRRSLLTPVSAPEILG